MNREEKAAVIDEIAGQITESEAIFAVDYRGITVTQVAELRTKQMTPSMVRLEELAWRAFTSPRYLAASAPSTMRWS